MNKPIQLAVALLLSILPATTRAADDRPAKPGRPKKIVLIAGVKSHGPVGNRIHDYPWSVKLIKVMLEGSNVAKNVRVEFHTGGWPKDPTTLDDADTIMVISDGRDGDKYREAPHFQSDERARLIQKQIDRGCGFMTFHFSTFAPDKYAEKIMDWSGGYFDWEEDGKRKWYSAIRTLAAEVKLGAPKHPVSRGVKPFKMREEFYYNIRFHPADKSFDPIWIVPALTPRDPHGRCVAWARQRKNGGRGFGTTCGHFYDNWKHADFRKMILNAICWTAHVEVPKVGVDARFYTHAEINKSLAAKAEKKPPVTKPAKSVKTSTINAVIVTGHQYPGHKWRETTLVLEDALGKDPRLKVTSVPNVEFLSDPKLRDYDVMIFNYCNWKQPAGISKKAKAGFTEFVSRGGGLVLIHFSNGAFHFSLPEAGASDWPEYRKLCRRVWDHTKDKSGHDAYGRFRVDIADKEHPITKGMKPFETIDELYFRQQGEEQIHVVASARSKVTMKDEPMAFVYDYGRGRVFQTVLGHAAESIRTDGASELIRRATVWAAGIDQTVPSPEKKPTKKTAKKLPKVGGHWGEDAIGFRWTEADSRDGRWNKMQLGPTLASVLPTPGGTTAKGLSIRLGKHDEAAVCYDTASMTVRAGWSGGFLKFDPARFGVARSPLIGGKVQFASRPRPGWGKSKVRYRGMYQHGRRVVLAYDVDGIKVLESPWIAKHEKAMAVTRAVEVGPRDRPLSMHVCDAPGTGKIGTLDGVTLAVFERAGRITAVAVVGEKTATINIADKSRIVVDQPAGKDKIAFTTLVWTGAKENLKQFAALVKGFDATANVNQLTTPGPALWTAPIVTRGKISPSKAPYVVDTITVPFANPYKALMFVSGHDFFANGDAALCTLHGDVWIVVGIDARLERVTWKRFATGLHQPLGLKIAGGRIYVLGRDQITRLHDRDGNGEADYYENFNNDGNTSVGAHDFAAGLETDAAGNFYYVRAHTGLIRVSADGRRHESLARGFRNPNGIGVGPDGTLSVSPQEGEWTPASSICEVKPGGHYGFGGPKVTAARPLGYDPPLCWLPRLVDNSSGGQVWVRGDRWGPLAGRMIHLSYGQCTMMLVLRETIDGQPQGGVVKLPFTFNSGVMRGGTNPKDGQLYLSGLRGWTTRAVHDGCFQRVRYTGRPITMPIDLRVRKEGIAITFSGPLDRRAAADLDNYNIEQWNYRYSRTYGSREYKPSQPKRWGRDEVYVESAKLLADGRTVLLELETLRPVMQMEISFTLKAADGTPLRQTIHNTIHRVGK